VAITCDQQQTLQNLQRRRPMWAQDHPVLLAMQRFSWDINFGGCDFDEIVFGRALRTSIENGQVWLYECRGRIVGWLWLDTTSPATGGHVRQLQVAQPYWGQGIGAHILGDAIALCRAQKCRAVTLNVTKSNQRAMSLYQRMGFSLRRDNGDRQYMELLLD